MSQPAIISAPFAWQDEWGARGATCICRSRTPNGLKLALTGEPNPPYDEKTTLPIPAGATGLYGQRRGFHKLRLLPHTTRQLSGSQIGLLVSALVVCA